MDCNSNNILEFREWILIVEYTTIMVAILSIAHQCQLSLWLLTISRNNNLIREYATT